MSAKRVLVWGLTNARAGTEAVICNFVRAIGERVAFDFLAMEAIDAHPEARADGNRVYVIPNKRTNLLAYRREMGRHFAEHAHEYAAVWSNLNILNNIDVLRIAKKHGVERRILHAHNSFNDGKLHQKLLCALHRPTFGRYVTDRWACSAAAGKYFFGADEYEFVPNAVDAAAYAFSPAGRERVRGELSVGAQALLVGCVGRLVDQKNYEFLVQAWPRVLERRPDAVLAIAGGGELRGDLQAQIDARGLSSCVRLLGARTDVADVLSAFDVFAMPSHFEGLPLSLVEAQFNGLPCVVSSVVTTEARISTGVRYQSLDDVDGWVDAIASAARGDVVPLDSAQLFDLASQADRLVELFGGV